MLLKEIITVYSEQIHNSKIHNIALQIAVTAGTYNYR
jgi:hypothetical protein